MRRIHVKASDEYDVVIGRGLIEKAGGLVKEALPKAESILIVADSNVDAIYGQKVFDSIKGAGFNTAKFVFEAGEQSKNTDTVGKIYEAMNEIGLTRTDAVVTLGGGVAGDMAGFAAATFLRGIRFVQIPTSLLAQVDASVGGKTGVDLSVGKNLVGAFHQPSMVIDDIDTLETLKDETFTEGMAEVIKYAMITDPEFYDMLYEHKDMNIREDPDFLVDMVERCVQNKVDVITEDEFDNGRRQLLNFGHTIGHVIECRSNYTVAHGVAVAKGMGIIARSCKAAGICSAEDCSKLEELCVSYGLPVDDAITAEDAASGAMHDKKKRGGEISLIVMPTIGGAVIKKMNIDELKTFIEKGQE